MHTSVDPCISTQNQTPMCIIVRGEVHVWYIICLHWYQQRDNVWIPYTLANTHTEHKVVIRICDVIVYVIYSLGWNVNCKRDLVSVGSVYKRDYNELVCICFVTSLFPSTYIFTFPQSKLKCALTKWLSKALSHTFGCIKVIDQWIAWMMNVSLLTKYENQGERRKHVAIFYGYAEGWDLSNHSFTDLSLSIDPEAIMFIVGWHAIQRTTSTITHVSIMLIHVVGHSLLPECPSSFCTISFVCKFQI